MRPIIQLAWAWHATLLLAAWPARGAATNSFPRVGATVELKFTAVDGREVDVGKLRGKVVLVDFWATWCGPCLQAMPTVKATYEKFRTNGFEVIGISFDKSKGALTSFTRKQAMPWPQYFDGLGAGNTIGARFGIESIPTMWLLDRQGTLRDVQADENLDAKVGELVRKNPSTHLERRLK